MTDAYSYWRAALAGTFGPVHDDHPQPGFYRARVLPGRDTPWTPVAIWADESGAMRAIKHMYVVTQPLLCNPAEVWTWCCDNPISEDAYRAVAERNEPWPSGTGTIRRIRT